MILILKGQDILFAGIAQGARVDGATLPSGMKVPVTPGYKWIIQGKVVRCIQETSSQANVQTELPE